MMWYVKFEVKDSDIPQWKSILKGLAENDEWGALFQDKMEVFGEEVDSFLESMMDEEPDPIFVEEWNNDGSHFSVEFEMGGNDLEFIKSFQKLLTLCPLTIKETDFEE